jgi:uncharacterized protein YceK
MKRLVLTLAALVALGGCGAPKMFRKAPKPAADAAAAASANLGDWRMTTTGTQAILVFGTEGGEPVLFLTCENGSGQVSIWRPIAEGAGNTLTLRSGTAQSSYLASPQTSPLDSGKTALALPASALDPVLQAFWKRGQLDLVDGETVTHLNARGGPEQIKPFFAFCAEAR